ncbi:transcriptional regulator [Sphaerisporangium krabiense]|uniref:DNA-binding HxlR family transcriptional regulator n=1 Tax=Sphaerisporangium krabiense TaxID=763782 RepID=A0A7W9DTM8_9ACTN|nr:winged helix-turn-helix transcriptional regulator [Sphaerisporangium krabiense]MBB5630786.1 DNA-binding HxlR family transcriptional regulator [Sphaerisporangium krabiense]GII65532.1 transcriptional regulator [Sphaerisporangium krabiense]
MARSYDDPCGVARALDVIGERWALLVVRELLAGPRRFTDLRTGLPGASQNVLSQRLRELRAAGVVRRRRLGPPLDAWVYELTGRGRELEAVLVPLARWGGRAPLASRAELSAAALVLALRTTFDAAAAGDMRATIGLTLGDDRFRAEVAGGRIEIVRGDSDRPDAVLDTDVATLRSLVFRRLPPAEAIAAGDLRLTGDAGTADRFLTLFPRPAPAP